MNKDTLKGRWRQAAFLIKRRWGRLTDDDLHHIDGDVGRLCDKLQERYGIARPQAELRYLGFEKVLESGASGAS